jgi:glucose/arabinose dehydrogenase
MVMMDIPSFGRRNANAVLRGRSRAKTAGCVVLLIAGLYTGCFARTAQAQDVGANSLAVEESAYYVIETVEIPEEVVLEVGGMALLPSGDIAAATRRGEVWIIEHPNGWGASAPHFRLFARGLHEPLGLAYHGGALYAAQRGELTRMEDRDGDGRADAFTTVYDWPVSGNYHEYSFGPVFRKDGRMIVALNLSSLGPMESLAKWRGWMLEVTRAGEMKPLATGMRSPAGLQVLSDGAVFYTENQGDWIGSGWLTHVEEGDFVGQPKGLRWSGEPGSPLSLKP